MLPRNELKHFIRNDVLVKFKFVFNLKSIWGMHCNTRLATSSTLTNLKIVFRIATFRMINATNNHGACCRNCLEVALLKQDGMVPVLTTVVAAVLCKLQAVFEVPLILNHLKLISWLFMNFHKSQMINSIS